MLPIAQDPIASAVRMTLRSSAVERVRRAVGSVGVDGVENLLLREQQAPCPVVHRFGPGVYIREVTLPAGAAVIGHRQRREQLNVMLSGRVTMYNDDGTTSELVAPTIFTGGPGRKAGFVHEKCTWLNVYATDETDIEKLEETYLDKSDAFMSANTLRLGQIKAPDADYLAALEEIGVTEEVVRAQAENEEDMTGLPFGGYKVKVSASPIEGKGLFATADIAIGEVIAPARIGGKRTIAGRYANHAKTPNAKAVKLPSGDIDFIALTTICGCRGGADGDEITVDYRQVVAENRKEN